jgi:hypothetical protein
VRRSTGAAVAAGALFAGGLWGGDQSNAQYRIGKAHTQPGAFWSAVVAADLVGTLSGAGPSPSLHPSNNDAFAGLLTELGVTMTRCLETRRCSLQLDHHVLDAVERWHHRLARPSPAAKKRCFKIDAPGGVLTATGRLQTANQVLPPMCRQANVHIIDKVILPANKTSWNGSGRCGFQHSGRGCDCGELAGHRTGPLHGVHCADECRFAAALTEFAPA